MGSFPPSPASTQITVKPMARGRQTGYHNYSDKEELLLCDIVGKILPTGRNMWEAVAAHYNVSKERDWNVRDFDSLRRKFRALYGKPKPTGNQGDQLTRRQRAILMSHEIQYAIEKKGGAHTSHDGRDNGQDDALLLSEVTTTFNQKDKGTPVSDKSGADESEEAGDEEEDEEDEEEEDGEEEEEGEEEESTSASTQLGEGDRNLDENMSGEPTDPSNPRDLRIQRLAERQEGRSTAIGVVTTPQGLVPAEFAADFIEDSDFLATGEDDEQESQGGGVGDSDDVVIASEARNGSGRASGGLSTHTPSPRSIVGTPPASKAPSAPTQRSVGRPRVRGKQPVPSVASPGGPTLQRNPDRAQEDALEPERYKRLNTTCDRPGGRDLRVLRDNFKEMGGREPGAKSKRSTSEGSTATTYAAAKRTRAKARMDAIDRDLKRAESAYVSTGTEMKGLLLFFREDADRRAEAEEKRRREEREERRADEKREREERETIRRDELKKEEAAREERRDQEAERRRQFEARLEQDRAEARQRHEQMMMLISTMQKNK